MASLELRRKQAWIENFGVRPIANSEWMAAMMRRSPMFENIDSIPIIPPIVEDVFQPTRSRVKAKKSIGVTDDHFVVGLSASSLTDPGKGIVEFFEGLPVGAAWLERVLFVLIGDGTVRVPSGVSAHFTGRIEDSSKLSMLYGVCDLVVSASFMETFGMAVLEAQACGTPVLAFRNGGISEAVYSSEPCGLLPDRNFSALYAAIEARVNRGPETEAVRLELAGWVASRHGPESIVERQIEIYEQK
ncbi:glycosyltransferase [Akkermansiaceae bacterium]|nr:glycosyltransferase [Akkermansiaceae bacterium]